MTPEENEQLERDRHSLLALHLIAAVAEGISPDDVRTKVATDAFAVATDCDEAMRYALDILVGAVLIGAVAMGHVAERDGCSPIERIRQSAALMEASIALTEGAARVGL